MIAIRIRFLRTMLIAGTISTTASFQAKAAPFVQETVDSLGSVGGYTSLALDSSGNPHISYYDYTNQDLKYASKSGGIWIIETVDAPGWVGRYTSLALDAQDNPHISYFYDHASVDSMALRHASKTHGIWTIETVDTGGAGPYTSLALDAQGAPHIAYQHLNGHDLKYASKSGGVWTQEIVDAAARVLSATTSLRLDTQNNPHISYHDAARNDLKYAHKSAGTWTTEIADSTGFIGQHGSLALDTLDNPHISYRGSGNLQYASKSGGTWTVEIVDATMGGVGEFNSLELDAQDNPHISYFAVVKYDLRYARKSGGSWTIDIADSSEVVGRYTSLELDAQGNPCISYNHDTNGDLKYATEDATTDISTLDQPARFALLGTPRPNPATGGVTTLSIQLSREQTITLALYDVRGRLLGLRGPARYEPGAHAVTWRLPVTAAGLYFVELRSPSGPSSRRSLVVLP